ncbi:Broad-complex core protein isoform 6 [Armadillidium nasatum]|uniref:Broad-complex core protein isoform 6 n=1 Tax=Armadillidium nasatum TaxID=96803 RepID=A0A5N5T8K1_9CRUS|nr:Broad-complex core protein isoform 6 [Armadillidium nasatum]
MNENLLSVTWNNHSSILAHNLDNFFRKESYCDATLICERKHIKVHKIVLSACSEYFRELFDDVVCLHPYIILKDVALTELEAVLEYMYNGKTSIFKARFSQFLNTADYFRVKGLSVCDSEFRSSVKICNVNSDSLSSSFNTLACDTIESISILNTEKDTEVIDVDEIAKEICSTKSSMQINANKGNESTVLENVSVSSVNKVQKNDNDHKICSSSGKEVQCTLGSCPEKENLERKPVILLDRNDILKKNKSSVSGDKRISRKVKLSERGPSLLSGRGESEYHGISNTGKNSSKENTMRKIKESEVLTNFDLCQGESNLNTNKNVPFRHNCHTCGFSAKFHTQLITHMKTHNIEKPKISKRYKCSRCTFSSLMKSHLERHIKGHKKPLKCKNCTFRASLNISMKKHEDVCLKGSVNAKRFLGIIDIAPNEEELPDISKPTKKSPSNNELPDIFKPTKENHPNKPFGKDYFQCAFCSHKTSSETLLTSHVKSSH